MSIRLDPRRVSTLKQLAAAAGTRPGDLVRQWVEERLDAARGGTSVAPSGAPDLAERVEALAARVAALESAAGVTAAPPSVEPDRDDAPSTGGEATAAPTEGVADAGAPEADAPPEPASESTPPADVAPPRAPSRMRRNAVAAVPSGERVALHDEMIEVLRERGPMTAAELAGAIAERGRYAPPRSGKALDAAMVSQRVSNPTYRSRFVRQDGRIGLAE